MKRISRKRISLAASLALVALACVACRDTGPPRVERRDDSEIAPVLSRTRDRTLTAPSADPGDSAPGLGTSEPVR